MVLSETTGEDTIYYLHGLGLVAESDGTSTDYFLTDGLGSVRQLTNAAATPLLAQTFDPYGNLYASAGAGQSAFGFTGEYTDASGLLYLRARYYNPAQGRFFQRDSWLGNAQQPRTLNPYAYSLNNPISYTDPSGRITETEAKLTISDPGGPGADYILWELAFAYGVYIMRDYGYLSWIAPSRYRKNPVPCSKWYNGNWSLEELQAVRNSVIVTSLEMGGIHRFRAAMAATTVVRWPIAADAKIRSNAYVPGNIYLTDGAFERQGSFDEGWAKYVMTHELAHRWDWKTLGRLSRQMEAFVMAYAASVGELPEEPPGPGYGARNILEAWAESFSAFVWREYDRFAPPNHLETGRELFINVELDKLGA